jgi:hypothetical protein
MNMPSTQGTNADFDAYALIHISSLAIDPFADDCPSKYTVGVDDATSRTVSSTSSYKSSISSSSQLSGWGSAISRKSYACLRTLEAECRLKGTPPCNNIPRHYRAREPMPQQQKETHFVGEGWGYFVDTKEC